MDKELYFGVDVSKKTLDLAYYDGETIDWKNAHIKVSNDDAGFKKIGSWVAKVGKDFETFVSIPLQWNGFCGWRWKKDEDITEDFRIKYL